MVKTDRDMEHEYKDQYKDYECELAKGISDLINKAGHDLHANAEYFANYEHRDLQQKLMQFFLNYTEEMAKNGKKGVYDARNEWACRMAEHICDLLKEKPFTF